MRDLPEDRVKRLIALYGKRRYKDVVREGERLARRHPNSVVLFNLLGAAHAGLGRLGKAVASYQRAVEIRPDFAEGHNNLGVALINQGEIDQAISSFRRAAEIRPDYAEAHNNLGVALTMQGELDQAVASCRRAAEIRPDYAEAHNNLGIALKDQGGLDEAVASYRRALEIRPDYAEARVEKLHQQAHMCAWAAIEEDAAFLSSLGVEGEVVDPFGLLVAEDQPARHRIRAERYARTKFQCTPLAAVTRPEAAPRRLRVGYFSSTFHKHPGMYLIAGLFEAHDREGFEIFAYSYGPDRQDEMRKRAASAVDGFEDVRGMSDEAVAKLARGHGLDVAVDLRGYSNDARNGIFAYRPAPSRSTSWATPARWGRPLSTTSLPTRR